MKTVARWEYKNLKTIAVMVGRPPKKIPSIDVIALCFRARPNPSPRDTMIYMTPDEAAAAISMLGHALRNVTQGGRQHFARRAR